MNAILRRRRIFRYLFLVDFNELNGNDSTVRRYDKNQWLVTGIGLQSEANLAEF